MTPAVLVNSSKIIGGILFFHLQGASKPNIMTTWIFIWGSDSSYEKQVATYKSARLHIPEDLNFHEFVMQHPF
jgi:hypothetical protein